MKDKGEAAQAGLRWSRRADPQRQYRPRWRVPDEVGDGVGVSEVMDVNPDPPGYGGSLRRDRARPAAVRQAANPKIKCPAAVVVPARG
jgi:hypothetical protein